MQEPHELHWKATKHIIRYVHGTITYGIHYATNYSLHLIGFIDSYWAHNNLDCKSTSGYILSFGFDAICWLNKRQVPLLYH